MSLNNGKTKEIIFVYRKRWRNADIVDPPKLCTTARVTSLTVLEIMWSNGLSASEHVRGIISSCAQTHYALRVQCAHGLCDVAMQAIFRSVILAKLLYASSAWWGFTSAYDRQRIDGFMRRAKRSDFCPPDTASFEHLCESADNKLVDK